jgi:uncharacterized protein (DUF983 family)
MLKKGTKIYSILTGSCPRCHQENMYVNKNPYNISETMKMHDHCSYCGLKYKMEPNFFFGAMYVSYALAVALSILIFSIVILLFHLTVTQGFVTILITLILMMPWVTRISRNIYINFFAHFDPLAGKGRHNG